MLSNILDNNILAMIQQNELDMEQIDWSNLSIHQIDVITAEVRTMCYAAVSPHLVLRKRASISGRYYHSKFRRSTHYFSRKQALNNLKLDDNRLKELLNKN